MKLEKVLYGFLIVSLFATASQSCNKIPVACFGISANADSIYVNQPVTFDGTCSYHAREYFWQFETVNDSFGAYNSITVETFTDTGYVLVVLTVLNGEKESSVSQTIHIKP